MSGGRKRRPLLPRAQVDDRGVESVRKWTSKYPELLEVLVPRAAVYSDAATAGPIEPPITGLVRRPGIGLYLWLFALFDAQARTKPGSVTRPFDRHPWNDRHARRREWGASWATLLGLGDNERGVYRQPSQLPDDAENPNKVNNRLRLRFNTAIDRLTECRLAEYSANGQRRRFWLIDPVDWKSYKAPSRTPPADDHVRIPIEFFHHCWHRVLTHGALQLLLALEHAQQATLRSAQDFIALPSGERQRYGIGQTYSSASRELYEWGLIDIDPFQTARFLEGGKVDAYNRRTNDTYRFSLVAETLKTEPWNESIQRRWSERRSQLRERRDAGA